MGTLPDESQDFIIANHVIEHMVDPIGALHNWQRVLKPGGRLFMAVPNKEKTFDINRPLTTIEHLKQDHEDPSDERIYQEFQEFALEVSAKMLNIVPPQESETLAKRMWDANYSIHFHVWNEATFAEFLAFLPGYLNDWRLETVDCAPTMEDEFVYVLQKRR